MNAAADKSAASSAAAAELARFVDEARITARLDHPGIVPVHDLGVDADGRPFFTMKRVQGRDLGEILPLAHAGRDGWSRTRAVGVLLRVCEAMDYAHAKGVVHRDLKPSNVMVGEFGEVYVMDWGIARVIGNAPPAPERAGGAPERAGCAGTPHSMAPEQARGEPAGPAADVYALGAMLYRLLAGRRPYEGEGDDAVAAVVLARVLRGPPRPLRELAREAPAELVAVAERAMAPRPEERYPSMRALADDLRAYLEGRVVRAHRTGALAELSKWVARNRLAASAIAAAVAAVVAGLAWSLRLEAANTRELDLASDYFRARVVASSADELWPAAPATIPALEDWIARAEALLARRAVHAERLRASEARHGLDAAQVDAALLGRQRALLAHLDELDGGVEGGGESVGAAEDGGADGKLSAVRARLAFASTIEDKSRTGAEAAALWREASASVRAGDTNAAYAGLELAPQLGLLPLGPDPRSGLWEFAHLETGEPARRGADGELALRPESGLVFVLLPGGTFRMGASTRRGEPNYDPVSQQNEWPASDVTLGPFLLAKHEMTQAQWERRAGRNPSRWPPGTSPSVTPRNPVEQVSFEDASAVLGRMGLVVPTEARWEYACRAGSDTPFACEAADLPYFANVGDQSYRAEFTEAPEVDAFTDGFAYHAPVGSLEPNELGLHDMHGNVMEWTLDHYGSLAHPRRAGDGLSLGPQTPGKGWWSPDYRVARGGNFEAPARYARASHRVNLSPTFINHALGVRPARELEPAPER